MRKLVRQLLNERAYRKLKQKCELVISPNVKIDYRGITARPPSYIAIGEGSIFQGRIVADRPSARISVGRNTFVGGSTFVCAESIDVGDDVLISWGCTIVDHNSHSPVWSERAHDVKKYYHGQKNWDNIKISPVRVGDRAWIGFNTIILPGVSVGEGAVVGSGSVVTKNVEPYTIVAGNPARLIRETT